MPRVHIFCQIFECLIEWFIFPWRFRCRWSGYVRWSAQRWRGDGRTLYVRPMFSQPMASQYWSVFNARSSLTRQLLICRSEAKVWPNINSPWNCFADFRHMIGQISSRQPLIFICMETQITVPADFGPICSVKYWFANRWSGDAWSPERLDWRFRSIFVWKSTVSRRFPDRTSTLGRKKI